MSSDIILQAFKWDARHNHKIGNWYNLLKSKIPKMLESKITMVWLPPACKNRSQDWVGYTPMDYYDLGEYTQWIQVWDGLAFVWMKHKGKETLYGSKEELLDLLTSMNNHHIVSIVDVVLNHRDPQQVNYFGEMVSWGGPQHMIASGKMVWGDSSLRPAGAPFWSEDRPEELATWYGGGSLYPDDGENGFSSNLAHENPKVRAEVKEWMIWLKEVVGFKGWRYDYVKGYDPSRIEEYNGATSPVISIGEYWDGNAQKISSWIDKTATTEDLRSCAFDFPLQSHLRQIFYGVKPFDELGLWCMDANLSLIKNRPGKAVTFLENHDTIRSANDSFPLDNKRLIQGYVFLLTHPGIPCIYWSHMFERNQEVYDTISQLCNIRKKLGLQNTSTVEMIEWQLCYVVKIDDHVLVQIGDYLWSPDRIGGNWNLVADGDGWAIWDRL